MQGPLSELQMPSVLGDLSKPVLNTTLGTWQVNDGYYSLFDASFSATPVPAPSAVALIGLVGAVGARRRRA